MKASLVSRSVCIAQLDFSSYEADFSQPYFVYDKKNLQKMVENMQARRVRRVTKLALIYNILRRERLYDLSMIWIDRLIMALLAGQCQANNRITILIFTPVSCKIDLKTPKGANKIANGKLPFQSRVEIIFNLEFIRKNSLGDGGVTDFISRKLPCKP